MHANHHFILWARIASLIGLILIVHQACDANPRRVFHNKEGRAIEAEIIAANADGVLKLRRIADGKEFQMSIRDLSLDDQQFLAEYLKSSAKGVPGNLVTPFKERFIQLDKQVPGRLELNSKDGFLLVAAEDDPEFLLGAAASLGKGKVVAFSHGDFCLGLPGADSGSGNLVVNALRWMCGKREPSIALDPGCRKMEEFLINEKFAVKIIDPLDVAESDCDVVIVMGGPKMPNETIEAVRGFVREGGALMIGATPWAWQARFQDFQEEFPANQILRDSGIVFLPKGGTRGKRPAILGDNPIVIDPPEK